MRTILAAGIFTLVLASTCSPVAAQNNPAPFLNNPTVPAAAMPGGPAFTLTVNGSGFVNGAAILWNGSPRTTTFASGIQLTAAIFASDIATASLVSVTVLNPGPGGGVSNPVLFSVATPTTSLAFTRSESEFSPGGGDSWASQPTGLVAGSNPADGTPVLAVADGRCPFLAFCVVDNGTIVKVGELGLNYQDLLESPQTIVIGDFNGDGALDFVTVGQLGPGSNPNPNQNLYAVVSPGDPTAHGFLPINEFPLPSGTSASPAPVVGDFDRDGHLDVVIGGQSAVYFVPGNGNGTLGTAISSSTESSAEGGLAEGDFNGDGILDLAVTNPLLNSVSILLGNGDGTFNTPADYATGPAPGVGVAGDFNGDGKLDLAVLDGSGATVSVLLGNGDGTFKPHVEYPAGFAGSSLTLGDLNGDGILDIAFSDTQCTNQGCPASGSVNILLGNGDGTFQSPLDFAAGGEPEFIVTTGLVGASPTLVGRAGIAVANYLDNTVSLFSPLGSQSGSGNPIPAITSISPTSAIEGSGSFTLTVNGSNFISSSTISFGGQAEPTTFVSAVQLTAAIPGSAIATAGPVLVLVSTPGPEGGVAESSFAVVLRPPAISSIVPSIVVAGSPGFSLTINGTNFVDGSTVNFNGALRSAAFVNSTQITASVSSSDVASQGTINISVTNPVRIGVSSGGTSSSVPLTIVPANSQPTVGALSPASTTAGGPSFTLTISGTGFAPSSVVTFASKTVDSAYQNPTELQAAIPANAIAVAGTQLVSVANPGGNASVVVSFTVNNPVPAAASISPSSVPAGNAALTLIVTGANFVPGSTVQVNGTSRITKFVSPTSLTAALLASDFSHSGTLSVTVNNPNPGGDTAGTLSLVVADFNVTAPSSSQTVTAGQMANYNLSLTAMNGTLGETVSFSASGLPSGASAAFTPSSLVAGSSSTSVALSIKTTPHSSASLVKFPRGVRPHAPSMYGSVLVFVVMCFTLWSLRGRSRPHVPQLLFVVMIAVVTGLAACGISGGSSNAQTNPATGTPAGTYTIMVKATSGNANVSTTLTLTVM